VARTLNPAVHAIRRDAFIDVAERMIQVKGYDKLSIQDLLDALGVSKGAFYHYFGSKAALLEAVIDRMIDAGMAALTPVLIDVKLSALDKLNGVFSTIASFKGERTELIRAVMEVWLADDNAIVREKFRKGTMGRLRPLLARIIEQGQAEGQFAAGSPDDLARVLVSFMQANSETATELYFARLSNAISFEDVERAFNAYRDAVERILGLPARSFYVVDPQTLRHWFG